MAHKLLQISNEDGFTEEILIDDTSILFTATDITNITGMKQGDFAVINNIDLYIYHNNTWTKLPNGAVTSVNSKTGAVTLTTTDINEGSNLYFTNTRAIDAVKNNINTDQVIEGTTNKYFSNTLAINAVKGNISTSDVTEDSNLYFTNTRAISAVKGNISTSDVTEGSNLYFTNTRAINAVNNQNINITGTAENANKLGNKTPDKYLFGQATDLGTVTSGAVTLDLSANNYFVVTVGANTTFTIANAPISGNVALFIVELTNGGNYSLIFNGLKWQDKQAPIFTTNGTDIEGIVTRDGGVSFVGFIIAYNIG